MRLFVLRLGEVSLDQGAITPGVGEGDRMRLPIMSYLIETKAGEALLVDTGMNRGHITGPMTTDFRAGNVGHERPRASARVSDMVVSMRAEDYIIRRLADIDVAASDIRYVINTHLHFDHAGNNGVFDRATFFVQRGHLDVARDNDVFPNEYWNIPGLSYEPIAGAVELFDGIEIIESGGHVPYHQSVLVDLPGTGPMLLCGDAIFCREQLDHDTWSSHANPKEAKETAHHLKSIAEDRGATIIYGHDPTQGRTLRVPPRFYD